ncbi:hypothetical protein JCM17380_28680 [Desulfosporosinus burensis]
MELCHQKDHYLQVWFMITAVVAPKSVCETNSVNTVFGPRGLTFVAPIVPNTP